MDVSWRSRVCKSEADETADKFRAKTIATRRNRGTRSADVVGDAPIHDLGNLLGALHPGAPETGANHKETRKNRLEILSAR
jgi:hypothetical protein